MRRLVAVAAFALASVAAAPVVAVAAVPSNCTTGNANPQGSWVICRSGTGTVAAMAHCSKGWTSRWVTSHNWAIPGSYSFAYCAAGEWRDGRSYARRQIT